MTKMLNVIGKLLLNDATHLVCSRQGTGSIWWYHHNGPMRLTLLPVWKLKLRETMYLGPSHTAHRKPNEDLTVGLKKKRVHPYKHVLHFSFLSCFNAALTPSSLCFWVILILERWVSFSFLNSTERLDVPSSLALKPNTCLYLCHLTSVVTCCRSAEIFPWKPYLAKYRLPFVRAFLRLCLLHALFYALPAPTAPPPHQLPHTTSWSSLSWDKNEHIQPCWSWHGP